MTSPKKLFRKPLLLRNKEFIIFLNSLPAEKRKRIIDHLQRKQINSISEICSNFLKKRLTTNKNIIKKASKYKKELRKIALKATPLKTKIKVLTSNRGAGLLGLLLPAAVSIISSLIGK